VTRKEALTALIQAAPGLREALRRWQREGRRPGDGLGDDLAAAARHLAGRTGALDPELPAALAVADRCLVEGPDEIRMAVSVGLILHLWWEVGRRPGGRAAVERLLPPYCRAIWEVCPEVDGTLRSAFDRIGWPTGVVGAERGPAADPGRV
jgi:hypothetical protein